MYGTAVGGAAGASGGSTGLMAGLMSNPVTAIAGAALGVVQLIMGIRKHHEQAVKTEKAALSDVTSRVTEAIKSIFAAANSGNLSPAQATAELEQIRPAYNSLIYQQYKVKNKAGNGADLIGKEIDQWIASAKKVFSSGGGTANFVALGGKEFAGHSDRYQGQSEFSLSYSPSSALDPFAWGSSITSEIEAVAGSFSSSRGWLIAGAVLLLVLILWRR